MGQEISVEAVGRIPLEFVPNMYHFEFVESVIELYEDLVINDGEVIPCIQETLGRNLNTAFFQGCLYMDTGREEEYMEQLHRATIDNSFDVWWEGLWHDFILNGFNDHYWEPFFEDIKRVLDAYRLVHATMYANPFNPNERFYSYYQEPILEVW